MRSICRSLSIGGHARLIPIRLIEFLCADKRCFPGEARLFHPKDLDDTITKRIKYLI